ncbi:hypothetical protein FBR04_09275 [Betaproteobacteria bacterium PRO7]|jgi:hypothetical protein|nr:hypothetical protein [Betaproteobacteria bacterium PRO7]
MGDATLYVVRVWRESGFRASVRRVDDEDTRMFNTAADMARYFDESVPGTEAPAAATRGDAKAKQQGGDTCEF